MYNPSSMPDVVTYISPLCIVLLFLLCFCRFVMRSCFSSNNRNHLRARDIESPHRCYRARRCKVFWHVEHNRKTENSAFWSLLKITFKPQKNKTKNAVFKFDNV
ncbi:hypothetical protein L596_021546 [Steinernema carpocapsae]|uniref:Uncharacterized protein n=1 Tax=Steinernema carpocapsae TaxID=34508 RepID=A0A4V6A002_STECR|nr:hypothetical protein L596_021546 [Steinernema carpocapsae]